MQMCRKATVQAACTQEDGSARDCNPVHHAADRWGSQVKLLGHTCFVVPLHTCTNADERNVLDSWCAAGLHHQDYYSVPFERQLSQHTCSRFQQSVFAGEPARAEPAGTPEHAAAYLKSAAAGRRLPPAQVLSAIVALEKAKLPVRCCPSCGYIHVCRGAGVDTPAAQGAQPGCATRRVTSWTRSAATGRRAARAGAWSSTQARPPRPLLRAAYKLPADHPALSLGLGMLHGWRPLALATPTPAECLPQGPPACAVCSRPG